MVEAMSFSTTAAACQTVMNVSATVVATTTLVVEVWEVEDTCVFIARSPRRGGRHVARSEPIYAPTRATSAVCGLRRSLRNRPAGHRGGIRSDPGREEFRTSCSRQPRRTPAACG